MLSRSDIAGIFRHQGCGEEKDRRTHHTEAAAPKQKVSELCVFGYCVTNKKGKLNMRYGQGFMPNDAACHPSFTRESNERGRLQVPVNGMHRRDLIVMGSVDDREGG